MRIFLPEQMGDEADGLSGEISDWTYVVPPRHVTRSDEAFFRHDYWLGSSQDGHAWALGVLDVCFGDAGEEEAEDHQSRAPAIVAYLLDPPMREPEPISEILLRVLGEARLGRLDEEAIGNIVRSVPFPVYHGVEHYLLDAPKEWHGLPCEWVVSFDLSDGACVYAQVFTDYARDSLAGVVETVCGPRHDGLLINYTLMAHGVIPLLQWDIDWPLARRGKAAPTKRGKVQGTLPWEEVADQSLLTIYQFLPDRYADPSPPYYGQPVVRLRVAGRSQEEAVANWQRCARAMRTLKMAAGLEGTDQKCMKLTG